MKRSFYLLANILVLMLLAACVAGVPVVEPAATAQPAEESAADDDGCEDGFRLFVHSAGETCVPENPQRIVTLQDQNGLLPLLELGVTNIVGSACHILPDGTEIFRRTEGFDTSGITCVGTYWGEANAESITALQPDLIIGYEYNDEFYDLHSQIAPTVLIQIFDRPLDEALMDFAALVNRTEQAEEMRADHQARLAALLEGLGDRKEQITLSVITPGDAGQFWRADTGQALGTVMDNLDFPRPAAQVAEGGLDAFSVETLAQHDADVMIVVSFTGENQDPHFEDFINSPILSSIGVAQAEQVYVFDGLRTVGAGWSKMNTFIDELEGVLLNPDLKIDVVQEAES